MATTLTCPMCGEGFTIDSNRGIVETKKALAHHKSLCVVKTLIKHLEWHKKQST